MRVPGHRRRWAFVSLMVISVMLLPGAIAGHADTPTPLGQTPFGPLHLDGERTAVTLVTGDRVLVGPSSGDRLAVDVIPARRPGRQVVSFQIEKVAGEIHVLPSDVAPWVGGLLDGDLFNITRLVAQGYDDAHTASLPLIVQWSKTARSPRYASAGLRAVRALPSVRATAVRTRHDRTSALRSALTHPGGGPLAGVTHVWLDEKLRATALDTNLTQIGAPTAWDAGLDGDGVRVAVLDTGIDTGHPDLAGQVVDQVNLTSSPDAGDHFGHGTHVAATVAGTGVASDGARKGVAHGADLLNVKVLGDDGFGKESQIIAGMEWAAAHDASVASMSLSGAPSDGSDVLSQAVNSLTASSGMLFVIAAGNSGPEESTVGTPGSADAALTVGAVDANDSLAAFSGRGPRAGDLAMKPDITAPGVDIVEARAEGTSLGEPVDDLYTKLSGTSMATPHVAGAAAILVGQHPDWGPARIKAVLECTATASPGLSVYQQGGGRLDVSRAIAARVVTDTNNLDFGVSDADASGTSSKTITLTNTGSSGATVDLATDMAGVDDSPVPAGTVAVSPTQLVLGPGDSGDVTVSLDPSQLPVGEYEGTLTATPDDSGPALHLPIGLIRETPHVQLSIHLRDHGEPSGGFVKAFNVDDATSSSDSVAVPANGDVSLRVVPGHYAMSGLITRLSGDGSVDTSSAVFDDQVDVTEDTEVTLDSNMASPIRAAVARRSTKIDNLAANYLRTDAKGNWMQSLTIAGLNNPSLLTPSQVRVGEIGAATIGTVGTYTQLRLIPADAPHGGASPVAYDAVFRSSTFPNPATYTLSARQVARFARVDQQFRALGDSDPGNYFEARGPLLPEGFARVLLADELQVPLHRVDYVDPDPDITWTQYVIRRTAANQVDYTDPEVSYRPGERHAESWFDAPLRQTGLAARNGDLMLVEAGGDWLQLDPPSEQVGDLLDSANRQQDQALASAAQNLRLWRNGELLAEDSDGVAPLILVPVDPAPARYRIERTVGPIAQFPLSVSSRTVWELTSSTPAGAATQILPLLQVDYSMPLDIANGAQARVPLRVGLRVRQTIGAAAGPVRTAKLWVSTDDGTQWTAVKVHRKKGHHDAGGRFTAVVPRGELKPGAKVSVRVSAADTAGNTVDQTVVRAFVVRAAG